MHEACWLAPQSLRAVVAGLRGKLPKEINLPASITVPFGSFEEVLEQANNNKAKKELDAASKDIPVEKAEEALSECRELVMQVLSVTDTRGNTPYHAVNYAVFCRILGCSAVPHEQP